MIWGRVAAVPAIGLWGTLFLGAALGIVAIRMLQKPHTRKLAIGVLVLAFGLPLTAGAVTLPFTFTNGTIADANQVNANFAALNPVTGYSENFSAATIGAQADLLSPAFTAPRAMTCLVTVSAGAIPPSIGANGFGILQVAKSENGVITLASAPPQNGTGRQYFFPAPGVNQDIEAPSQTVMFTVGAGATVQFGGRAIMNGDLVNSRSLLTTVTYLCQ
jgi:hypothetical protein